MPDERRPLPVRAMNRARRMPVLAMVAASSQSASSDGRKCLVEWIEIAYYKWSKL